MSNTEKTFILYVPDGSGGMRPCKFWGQGRMQGGALAAFTYGDDESKPDIVVALKKMEIPDSSTGKKQIVDTLIIAYSDPGIDTNAASIKVPPAEMLISIAGNGQNKTGPGKEGDSGLYWLSEAYQSWPTVVTTSKNRVSETVWLAPYDDNTTGPKILVAASRSSPKDLEQYAGIAISGKHVGTSPMMQGSVHVYGLLPDSPESKLTQAQFLTSVSGGGDSQSQAPGGGGGFGKKLAAGDAAALARVAKQFASVFVQPEFAGRLVTFARAKGDFKFVINGTEHDCNIYAGALPPVTQMANDVGASNLDPQSYGVGAVMTAKAGKEELLIVQPTPGSSMVVFFGKDKEKPEGIFVAKWMGHATGGNPVWEPKTFGKVEMRVTILPFSKNTITALIKQLAANAHGHATP